jgi:hypothetical protein
MHPKFMFHNISKLASVVTLVAFVGYSFTFSSCNKKGGSNTKVTTSDCFAPTDDSTTASSSIGKSDPQRTLTSIVTVADMNGMEGSSAIEVVFNENTEFFTVTDPAVIAVVKEAFSNGKPIQVSFNPWKGTLLKAEYATGQQAAALSARLLDRGAETAVSLRASSITDEVIDNPTELGTLNLSDTGLNNLIPDFATAQLMFNYIAKQCCAIPGPYAIDYCIPFQYCIDGCYARAHKMCWIINRRYKYGTKKVFSFATPTSTYKLSVQGQKWGGCCIRWWYHVAPLVTVKTPTGPKAYVFDPAMFNQPVLLSVWLHAQENPVCSGSFIPKVTMYNIRPTASYAPSGTSGLVFSTDPTFSATNNTLYNYRNLITCP